MAPTTRDAKRRARAAADLSIDTPSSSSSTSTSVPVSTSNAATGSQTRATKKTRRTAAGKSNNPAPPRSAISASSHNPPADDNVKIVKDDAEASKSDVEMADEATVTENARNGEGIPVPSHYHGSVPDNVAGDTDKEEDLGGDTLQRLPLPHYRYPQTEDEKNANAIYNAVLENSESLFGLPTGEMTSRLEAAEIKAKAKARAKAAKLACRAIITADAAKVKAGQRAAHANARWEAIKRAAKAEADGASDIDTAAAIAAITPPSPAASSKDAIPRFDRKIAPLPSRLPRALREVHNPLPPPRFGTPGGGRHLVHKRSLKHTKDRRFLKNTERRLQFKELIKDSGSGLRVSVRADGQDGEFAPIAYRADREVMYVTEDEEVFVGRDAKGSFEYEYGEEDMAPFMGVIASMGGMSIKNRQEDKGEDKDFEEEAELEDDDDGFDGDDEASDHDAEPSDMSNPPVMRNLKRRRDDEDSEGGSDDKQERPKAPKKKKQRILRYYEGSDEDTPVASASQAEDNLNPINESEEPSLGSEDEDEQDDRTQGINADVACDPESGEESQEV